MTKLNSGLAYKLPDEQFKKIIIESTSCSKAMRSLGFACVAGNARVSVYRRIYELDINIKHWADNTKNAHAAITIPHDDYFAKDTPHVGAHIRERILKYDLLPYKCTLCGNDGEWNGEKLVLQIDHKNGDHNDNRLENLQFLCPNCHSQTETFAGKNVKR